MLQVALKVAPGSVEICPTFTLPVMLAVDFAVRVLVTKNSPENLPSTSALVQTISL